MLPKIAVHFTETGRNFEDNCLCVDVFAGLVDNILGFFLVRNSIRMTGGVGQISMFSESVKLKRCVKTYTAQVLMFAEHINRAFDVCLIPEQFFVP